ncbi:MAG: GNAT family N-acetyltransferase [Proteobacteria bacterium]|nr:GNAT family N-acetyltransferase [Pseudomonadota bacterium]
MSGTDALFDALEASWPPASSQTRGPFRLRDGAGGGKRVSAALLKGPFDEAALDALDAPLFQLRPGQEDLDRALHARGYRIVDPTVLMEAPVEALAVKPKAVSLPTIWPPLAIQRRIWAEGHVGPERLAVMARAVDPKMSFIARIRDKPAGVGFLAIHEGIAMVHAVHVEPAFRRQGVGAGMMRGMAYWAQQNGAHTLALAVTEANAGARALYRGLGMTETSAYHYRERAS